MLTVSGLFSVARLGFIFEDDSLFASPFSLGGGKQPGSLDSRSAYGYIIAIADEHYSVKLDSIALGHTQTLYIYNLTGRYLVLFTTGFNDCVNLITSKRIILPVA